MDDQLVNSIFDVDTSKYESPGAKRLIFEYTIIFLFHSSTADIMKDPALNKWENFQIFLGYCRTCEHV